MTTFSPEFRFVEANLAFIDSDDEADWVFGLADHPAPFIPLRPIRDRFVYVFVRDAGQTSSRLYAEYFIDGTGLVFFCDGQVRKDFDITDEPARLIAEFSRTWALPIEINGAAQEFLIFGARTRLANGTLGQLINNRPKSMPFGELVFLEKDAELFAPVLDPLTAARQVNLEYQEACDALINYTMTYNGQPKATADKVRTRFKKLPIARLLASATGNAKAKAYAQDYDKTISELSKARDQRGARLTRFLRSELVEFTESLYATQQEDYHAFLRGWGPCCARLNECPNGRARLGDWLRKKPLWITMVLPESELSDGVFQVVRKAAGAVSQLWAELAPAIASDNPKKAPEILERSIQFVTRQLLWTRRETVSFVTRRFTVTSPVTQAKYDQFSINKTKLRDAIADWAVETRAQQEVLEHFNRLAECVNLILAAHELVSSSDEPGFKALNLLGAGCDSVVAFEAFGKLSARKLLTVAAISAGIDAVLAAKDAKNAYAISDDSAAVGFTSVSLGSALMFLGFASGATGIGASATIVGLPLGLVLGVGGAVLVGAGYIIAVFTADSDMDIYQNHCVFGGDFGEGADASRPWSEGPFAEWKTKPDGLERQLRALYALLGSFSVDPITATQIRITPGLLTPESVFLIDTTVTGVALRDVEPTKRFIFEVRPGKKSLVSTGGDPMDMADAVSFFEGANGLAHIIVKTFPAKDTAPSLAFLQSRAEIKVRLKLDGNVTLPLGNRVVSISRAENVAIVSPEVSSKDF